MEIYIVEVIDAQGTSQQCAFNEYSQCIYIGGYDNNNKYHQFESEPRHLSAWCDEHNFQLKDYEIKVDIKKLKALVKPTS